MTGTQEPPNGEFLDLTSPYCWCTGYRLKCGTEASVGPRRAPSLDSPAAAIWSGSIDLEPFPPGAILTGGALPA
jgi:hypothetical protein